MKKINWLTFSFSFAGFFLGAGYISGQELWQFFGSFGKLGFIGIIFAVALLAAFGIIVIRLVQLTGESELGKVIVVWNNPVLQNIFVILEIFFLFGIYVIMTAGVSALLHQTFSIPTFIGSILFTVIVTLVAVTGVKGLTTAFSITVPTLVITCIGIFIYCAVKNGFSDISFSINTNDNPLISTWFISAVVFVSYNLFSSIGILSPYGKIIENKKTVYIGTICGSLFLLIIALGILFALSANIDTVNSELPMLSLASKINPIVFYLFSFLLFGGMFGTSVSSVFAIDQYIKQKFSVSKKKSVVIIILLSVLAFVSSLAGFEKLISIVYPVCGYLGIAALVLIVIHFIYAHKNKPSI